VKPLCALLAVGALCLTGCSLGDDGESPLPGGAEQGSDRTETDEAQAIREWSAALNGERYEEAASFFAEGAIVEQAEELRLADRAAAVAFNRSLPCKADVTDVEDEGDTLVAAFRLRGGPAGGCDGGTARVRFRFRDGKFSEWRQLTPAPPAEGEIARQPPESTLQS